MIFSGKANPALAQKIVDQLRIPLGKASVAEFSDSETAVEILENVRGRDIFLIQTTCQPTNHNLMEMLIMVGRVAGGLNQKNVATSNILKDFYRGFTIGKFCDRGSAQRDTQLICDFFCKCPVGIARKHHHV